MDLSKERLDIIWNRTLDLSNLMVRFRDFIGIGIHCTLDQISKCKNYPCLCFGCKNCFATEKEGDCKCLWDNILTDILDITDIEDFDGGETTYLLFANSREDLPKFIDYIASLGLNPLEITLSIRDPYGRPHYELKSTNFFD